MYSFTSSVLAQVAIPSYSQSAQEGGPATICDLQVLFIRIVSVIITLAGITLFVMLVIGSFKMLTSGGEPKNVEGAKNTMTYAIIGLGLMLGSYIILKLIEAFTGVEVTKFGIPGCT